MTSRASPAPPPAPRFTISVPTLTLGLAFSVQAVLLLIFIGGLIQRVAAVETDITPVRAGKVAVLEERTIQIQSDVAWIRDRLEKEAG